MSRIHTEYPDCPYGVTSLGYRELYIAMEKQAMAKTKLDINLCVVAIEFSRKHKLVLRHWRGFHKIFSILIVISLNLAMQIWLDQKQSLPFRRHNSTELALELAPELKIWLDQKQKKTSHRQSR